MCWSARLNCVCVLMLRVSVCDTLVAGCRLCSTTTNLNTTQATCVQCVPPLFLHQKSCVSACPSGWFANATSGSCQSTLCVCVRECVCSSGWFVFRLLSFLCQLPLVFCARLLIVRFAIQTQPNQRKQQPAMHACHCPLCFSEFWPSWRRPCVGARRYCARGSGTCVCLRRVLIRVCFRA